MPLENADKDKDKKDEAIKGPAAPVEDDVGKEGTQAERMLDRIIARYGATAEGVAKGIYDLSSGERERVMIVVQTRFGNGFTNEVERAIGFINQDRASGGGGDSKDTAAQQATTTDAASTAGPGAVTR